MVVLGETVDTNFQSNFQGMSAFSMESRRRRRLQGKRVANVSSVEIQSIRATENGRLLKDVITRGSYHGSQLKPDSSEIDEVQQELTVLDLDFTSYSNPGGNTDSEDVSLQIRRGAANVLLEKQNFEDTNFMSRQPSILPPTIEIWSNAVGTENNPIELPCSGTLEEAWSLKLNGAEPEIMRRRRTRALSHASGFETVLEYPAEASIVQLILNGTIPITIFPGGSSSEEEDIFGPARALLGTDGVGSFMDTSQEGIASLMIEENPADYDWEVDVETATPLCDKLEWTFVVTASDSTGTSEPLVLHAFVVYGEMKLNDAPQNIQTR